MTGACATFSKSLLFNSSSFLLFPECTLAVWISTCNTADVGSGDAKVRVEFHLSKLPVRALEDFILNRMELWMGVTWKTGTCARDGRHNNALATTRQMAGSRITRVWMRGAFLSTGQWLLTQAIVVMAYRTSAFRCWIQAPHYRKALWVMTTLRFTIFSSPPQPAANTLQAQTNRR